MECVIFHEILILMAMFPFFFFFLFFQSLYFTKVANSHWEKDDYTEQCVFWSFFLKTFSKRAKTLPPNKSLPPQKSVPQGKRHLVLIYDKGKGIIIYYCMGTLW
jgi:hypothetical protein